MNLTSPVPHTFIPEEENAQDRSNPAADTADGLVDAEAAEKFQQAVEQRLSEPALRKPAPRSWPPTPTTTTR